MSLMLVNVPISYLLCLVKDEIFYIKENKGKFVAVSC